MSHVSLTERYLCHLDFSHSFPNRSLMVMTYALIRKQHRARQNVSDFTISNVSSSHMALVEITIILVIYIPLHRMAGHGTFSLF